MKFLSKYPLISIVFSLMLGIWIKDFLYIKGEFLVISWLILIVLLIFFHFRQTRIFQKEVFFPLILNLLSFFTGMLLLYYADVRQQSKYFENYLDSKSEIYLELLVKKKIKTTNTYQNFIAEVVKVNNYSTTGNVLIHFLKSDTLIKKGVYILSYLDEKEIKTPNKIRNLYGFNYKKYLEKQDIFKEIYFQNLVYKVDYTRNNMYKSIEKIRSTIKKYLASGDLSKETLAFANTILLGDRNEISKELYNDFQSSGTMHVLAISGLHIGILLLFLNFLLYPLKRKYLFVFLFLILIFLWFYAFISGFSPSVVRAVLMYSLFQIGYHFKRTNNTYNILFVAIFFMLLYNPKYLFQVGFQMSFMAVWAILSFYPFLQKLFYSKYKLLQWWFDLFSVSISAQLGILPLSLYYFHQFPLYFWLANLFVIPLLFLLLFIGFILVIFSFFHIKLFFLFNIFDFLSGILMKINHAISNFPLSLIQNISFNYSQLFVSLIAIFIFFLFLKNRKKHYLLYLLLSFIIAFQILTVLQYREKLKRNKYYVFYQYDKPIIAYGKENILRIYQAQKQVNYYLLKALKQQYKQIIYDSIPVFYNFMNNSILHIDSLGIYTYKNYYPDIIILHNSPKINFDRMLKVLKPSTIIVDATNKYSFIKRWELSAKKNNIQFYDINKNGAFVLSK